MFAFSAGRAPLYLSSQLLIRGRHANCDLLFAAIPLSSIGAEIILLQSYVFGNAILTHLWHPSWYASR